MLTFIFAFFLLIITPGPGVLSIAGVGSAFGFKYGIRYLIGLFLGTNLVALAVVSGVAALFFTSPFLRVTLLTISCSYLLYLAWNIAFSGSEVSFKKYSHKPGILSGIFLQIVNPKAYVVSATLFSGFPLVQNSYSLEIFLKLLITNLIWIPVHFLWLYIGVAMKRLNLSVKTQRGINYAMGLAMVGVVLLSVFAFL
ncbi:MAG: threonine/homoserine/homoserine lactone efflux protein [Paracoccaceae bacterium]